MHRVRPVLAALLLAFAAVPGTSTFAGGQTTHGTRRAQFAERRGARDAASAAIREVLDRQVEAWNRGDLEGYMAGYWKSEQLTFFSGGTVTRGWEATLARYRKRYQSAGKASMGKLDLSEIEIQPLGPRSALARGRWHLVMADQKELGGLTTLILRQMPDGWRIVHDHSCSD